MRIIISPAMKMQKHISQQVTPLFFEKEAKQLNEQLQKLTLDELKALWNCSDQLAGKYQKYIADSLTDNLTPAIASFEGIQYLYLTEHLLSDTGKKFLQEHVRILSGLYGVLRPYDGVKPYRLEMKNKLNGSLYDFWANKLADNLYEDNDLVLNLASNEYAKAIKPYTAGRKFVTVQFLEKHHGKYKTLGVHAKMSRGRLVHYICENQITDLAGVKQFSDFNYRFSEADSTDEKIVFKTDKFETK
ncbi:MAG: peroxide stress protein YaaA [Lactobacillus sp.]|nr:peroxide stress protein YaaA [Lactobacillus sp.]